MSDELNELRKNLADLGHRIERFETAIRFGLLTATENGNDAAVQDLAEVLFVGQYFGLWRNAVPHAPGLADLVSSQEAGDVHKPGDRFFGIWRVLDSHGQILDAYPKRHCCAAGHDTYEQADACRGDSFTYAGRRMICIHVLCETPSNPVTGRAD